MIWVRRVKVRETGIDIRQAEVATRGALGRGIRFEFKIANAFLFTPDEGTPPMAGWFNWSKGLLSSAPLPSAQMGSLEIARGERTPLLAGTRH